ncbi:MAG: TolC family protein [Bdellovibrionaceae bacterium]|nr:TolC family protein [Pseudobdellovibrionaceae bacterium]
MSIYSFKNLKLKYLITGLILFLQISTAKENTFNFNEVWKKIFDNSSLIQASSLEVEASNLEKDRASRHWLPKVYLDIKTYKTNDPGMSFFGLLEQKALKNDDFNSQSINNPSASHFSRGSLGLDLALYEGNFKTTYSSMMTLQSQLKQTEKKQKTISLYSEVLKAYTQLGIFFLQDIKLAKLSKQIDTLLNSYQLGQKSNPIGYSGLLGLKSLSLKIKGLNVNNKTQIEALKVSLYEIGFKEKNWKPNFDQLLPFLDKLDSLLINNPQSEASDSFTLQTMNIKKQMSETQSSLEKSRFLPRVGIFAETYTFLGDRDSASGYNTGIYLQWNLFRPEDYGVVKESRLKTLTAEKYYQTLKEQDQAEIKSKNLMITSLKENLELLNQSESLIEEQTRVSENLFKNGSINILQLLELLNRKIDLITLQMEVSQKLVQLKTENLAKSTTQPQ